MLGLLEFQDTLEQLFRKRKAMKKISLSKIQNFTIFGDSIELIKDSLDFDTCSFEVQNEMKKIGQIKQQHNMNFIFYSQSLTQMVDKNGFEIQKEFLYYLKKQFFCFKFQQFLDPSQSKYQKVEFSRIIQKNSFLKNLFFSKYQNYFEFCGAQNDISFIQAPHQRFAQMLNDYLDFQSNKKLLMGSLICFLLDPDLEIIVSNFTLTSVHYYDLKLLAQSFNISLQKMRNLLLLSFFYYQSYQRHDYADVFFHMKNNPQNLYKQFKFKMNKRFYELTFLLNYYDNVAPEQFNPPFCFAQAKKTKNLSINKLNKCYQLLYSSYIYDQKMDELKQSPLKLKDNFKSRFLLFGYMNLLEAEYAEILSKVNKFNAIQQIFYPHFAEQKIIFKNSYIEDYRYAIKLLAQHFDFQGYQKISFKNKNYYGSNLFKVNKTNMEQSDINLYFIDSIQNFYLSFIQFSNSCEKTQQISLATLLHNSFIQFLAFKNFIDLDKHEITVKGQILYQFGQNGFFEEGILFLEYLRMDFLNDWNFLLDDTTNWVYNSTSQNNKNPKFAFVNYQKFKMEIFQYDEIDFFEKFFSNKKLIMTQQNKFFQFIWNVSEKNPTQFSHPHQDYTFIFMLEIFILSEQEEQIEKRGLWDLISQTIRPYFETIHFISIVYSFFNQQQSVVYQDQRSERVSNLTNLCKTQMRKLIKTFFTHLCLQNNFTTTSKDILQVIKLIPYQDISSSGEIQSMKTIVNSIILLQQTFLTRYILQNIQNKQLCSVKIQRIIKMLQKCECFLNVLQQMIDKPQFIHLQNAVLKNQLQKSLELLMFINKNFDNLKVEEINQIIVLIYKFYLFDQIIKISFLSFFYFFILSLIKRYKKNETSCIFSTLSLVIYLMYQFQSRDFAPVGAGQNEVFFSNRYIYKEIRMPKNKKQSQKKAQELQEELQALTSFSNEFYIAGFGSGQNQCTFTYIATDIINLDEDFQYFTPFQAQKWQDFYYYQDRLVRHRFIQTKDGKNPHFNEVYKRLKKDKDFYLTYFLKMKKAQGDLFDMLQDESTQNWGWRLDISLQLIRYFKLFKSPRFNKLEKQYENWHHLDIKPENILMHDFYTPLIADLGNASKSSQLFNGSLKGTTAFLDPTIITLQLFYQPENEQQKNEKDLEIQKRYLKADQYALGATLLKILMPHIDLDYDAETYSSNIQQIIQNIESEEEQAIIGFLRNLLTDHYELRSTMEQAESLLFELIYYLKQQLGESLQLVQYLENQFDFYLSNKYDKIKKKLWANYIEKIQKYQEYYDSLVEDDQQDEQLEKFFERFNKMTNNKTNYVYRQKNANKSKLKIQRMETNEFFQKENNFIRSKTIAENRNDLLKNGLFRQFKIIGNELNFNDIQLKKLRTKNYDTRNNSSKRSITYNDLDILQRNKNMII